MMLGGGTLGSLSLGSILRDPGALVDPLVEHPFTLEINGVNRTTWFDRASLQQEETVGQPATCDFVLINPSSRPQPGDRVRIRYYSEVLFAGMIERIALTPNSPHTKLAYACTCKDWSVLLLRRKLRRNFTNLPVANIVDTLLDNELAGEGFTLGTIDIGTTIPLVDVRNARAFDVLRDVGGATGQSVLIDAEKRIHFLAGTTVTAPRVVTNDTVESASLVEDLETYRNVQTVIVTGTPASQNEDAQTVVIERSNADQIAARAAIEGGTGRVEDIEEVTHPTSNAGADLALLGIGYANLRLATSGTPRRTLRVQMRGYGFRAGQFASVDLPGENAAGTWLIQRVSYEGQFGRYLIYALELVPSSRQQRAYEAWLSIVRAGKVIVQLPGAVTSNLATFNTPGTTTWPAPITGTVELTCYGASGSGGGSGYWNLPPTYYPGGRGGHSGKAVSVISVITGQVYDIVVGTAGSPAGSNGVIPPLAGSLATNGVAGTLSSVMLAGVTKCQGDGGGGGNGNTNGSNGTAGTDGSGIGDAVTVGGGRTGGLGGTSSPATDGADGLVEIRW